MSTLTNPGPGKDPAFGKAVSVSGALLAVGASAHNTEGRVYLFNVFDPSSVSFLATIENPGGYFTEFGSAVAVAGSQIVVGAVGLIHVYDFLGPTPTTPAAVLRNPNSSKLTSIGPAVAISGSWVVAGAPYSGEINSGSAYGYDLASATPDVPAVTLNSPSPSPSGDFGNTVAISGSLMVIGAPSDDTRAPQAGSVFVFDLASATPTVPMLTLFDPVPQLNGGFGCAVAIDGRRVIVGAYAVDAGHQEHAGCAYVYDLRTATPELPILKLHSPTPTANASFGFSVAISGPWFVVGAFAEKSGAGLGKAYVYDVRSPTPSTPIAALRDPVGNAAAFFGWSVAISGQRIVVGAPGNYNGASPGHAYAFNLTTGLNTQPILSLQNKSPQRGDWFGAAVAIDGTRVVVGGAVSDLAGKACLYHLEGVHPGVPVATLADPSPVAGDFFGCAVAISGTRVIVGAHGGDTDAGGGAAYVYDFHNATVHNPVAALVKPVRAPGDHFGFSVAIDGSLMAAGAPRDDLLVAGKGAAYVFGPGR
jgi:hypothetical protein